MATFPKITLVRLEPGAAGNVNACNEMLTVLASIAGGVHAVTFGQAAPPGSPADGDCHVVGASPSGDWATFAQNDLAVYVGSAWKAFTPWKGLFVYDDTNDAFKAWNGTAWNSVTVT